DHDRCLRRPASPMLLHHLGAGLDSGDRGEVHTIRHHPPDRSRGGLEPWLGRHHGGRDPADPGPGDRDRPPGGPGLPRPRDRPLASPCRTREVGAYLHLGYGRQVGGFGWAELIALLTSIGFGTVSAIIPIVNAEAYVIASQMSAVMGPIPIAIGIAIGQTVGKLLLFFGVRRGKELSFVKHRQEVRKQRPVGPTRARFRAAMAKLLDLVGQERWGLPIVLVAAIV